jgi:phenylalanyl-tRNA synthetase beta chain
MRISPTWLREFVNIPVDDRRLADDLTNAGVAVEGFFGEGAALTYEVEFTANRVDQMNHYGVARECAAIYDADLRPFLPALPQAAGKASFKIEIEDPKGCARYTARIVRGVTVGPSPEWIVERLARMESRPIYNAADATNYALFEIGHPTHAFDLDLLEGGKIIVRRAREGEMLTTLDGVERKLSREDLVIADARKPVALAGVMGGLDSAINENTKNVLIESAWFDPVSIRKTARRHGMHTDASHRFERGADWGITAVACARVTQLIIETAGGQLEGEQIDAVAREITRPTLRLRRKEILRHLGQEVPEEDILRILRRLGFGVTPGRSSSPSKPKNPPLGVGGAHAAVAEEVAEFTVAVPTWRLDVDREIDLVEEVARVYGFDRFPDTLPEFSGAVVELPEAAKDAKLRSSLLALGYNEAVSLTFIGQEETQQFSSAPPVQIANPLSEEAAYMRNSMLPGMLSMLAWNLNRGNSEVRLFEAGKVYERVGERAEEQLRISLGATGNARPAGVHEQPRAYTFFDIKGDVATLLHFFEHRSLYFDANTSDYYHPGRSARAVMDGSTVAQFGQLHPAIAARRKLRQDVFVGEILLNRLYRLPLREARYTPIPRFPAVDRDFSFVFDDAVTFERIRTQVEALRLSELRSFLPVEIFRGGAVPAGRYSVLLRANFQSPERTLRDDEVALWAQQIIKALEALGGTLRA